MKTLSKTALAAALCCAISPAALAQALPKIDVTSAPLAGGPVAAAQISRADLSAYQTGSSDTAAMLRNVAGVATYNGGGFSGVPSIRGLTGKRLSILVDGAPIDIACPNDMNPPLSYTDPQTVDAISVITGVSPV
ncbi:MAG TPA: Plug domain-containing protein, partial [Pedomonas sp.]|nr:Plug domain-containing protein [Pedomonas sp.]